jgi:hypothetical protein
MERERFVTGQRTAGVSLVSKLPRNELRRRDARRQTYHVTAFEAQPLRNERHSTHSWVSLLLAFWPQGSSRAKRSHLQEPVMQGGTRKSRQRPTQTVSFA